MSMSRRKTLALIGGGVVFAATASAGGFVATRTPAKALEPWDLAGRYDDPRLQALSYALLAPNPHNRQPWEAELQGENRLVIYRDKSRGLPITDPFYRQLTIGMGCFLELMDIAAAQAGYKVNTSLFPRGEDGPVAECEFATDAAKPDPLFAHVLNRRSHKEMFDDKQVGESEAAPLKPLCDVYLGGERRDTLRRIADEAWWTEITTPAAWQESVDLFRIGKAEINANPDGIDVSNPLLEALFLSGLMAREAASDINDPNVQAVLEETSQAIKKIPAFTTIRTPGNSRIDQIEAGRRWLRLNLTTTANGLALRPVSQALQEYAEMKPLYDEIHTKFAENGETIQMLGLLGYAERTPRTPRWRLETRIKNG